MIALGFDLCEITRITRILEKNPAFLHRYFTSDERDYITARGNAGAQSAAAMFAAKEAFLKATGLGIGGGITLDEISITHNELGAPAYLLSGNASEWMLKAGAQKTHLSISHDAGIAGAVCIIE
ncbi:MAG: holo-ACP synthase [Clostridiales bacterium]|nr:holo-ACP synthase [Clostridiales bacterium]